jgi:hypothetical protein
LDNLPSIIVRGSLKKRALKHGRETDDQINRRCRVRLGSHSVFAGHAAGADSPARWFDYSGRLWLWSLQDENWRRLRRQNDHPPNAPTVTPVCALDWRRLRSVGVRLLARTVVRVTPVLDSKPTSSAGRRSSTAECRPKFYIYVRPSDWIDGHTLLSTNKECTETTTSSPGDYPLFLLMIAA